MKSRVHDARRLDVAAAARDGTSLEGDWPLAGFERLLEPGHAVSGRVQWSLRAGVRPVPGGDDEVWLELHARAEVPRECQRCLQPVALAIVVDRRFVFVAGEERAAELDAESDDEVLALTRSLDLHELVEDELLLALPVVPRHDVCPSPLPLPGGADTAPADEGAAPAENPFAVLAALKSGRGDRGH